MEKLTKEQVIRIIGESDYEDYRAYGMSFDEIEEIAQERWGNMYLASIGVPIGPDGGPLGI